MMNTAPQRDPAWSRPRIAPSHDADGAEDLVNAYATPARIAEAHRRLARARRAPTDIQRAVTAAYGPLLRQRDTAAWVADLSDRVAALGKELEALDAAFRARFPQPPPFSLRWIGGRISRLIGLSQGKERETTNDELPA